MHREGLMGQTNILSRVKHTHSHMDYVAYLAEMRGIYVFIQGICIYLINQ